MTSRWVQQCVCVVTSSLSRQTPKKKSEFNRSCMRFAAGMPPYILGLDVGTTSIKAVLLESESRSVAASQSLPTASDVADSNGIKAKEQDTGRILETLNQCVGLLPADKLQHVCSIGVSGQMHGVLFWNAESDCDWSRGNFSQLITWQDGRCSNSFLSSLPKPDSHLAVATGFGCATIFWYMKQRPEFLKNFTVAGTIQDYVVSKLCGLDRCLMTPQNAASWGFYNTSSKQWNLDILNGVGFPLHLLPQCVPSGELAGHTRSGWHGIPVGTPVGAALGDFQCAVYSCLSAQTDAVAAALNGGNVLATFVDMLTGWMKELGVELNEQSLYEKMISCALNQESSDLAVHPTVLGERHAPFTLGQVTNISTSNLSLGHVTRALCRGILENLASMMTPERLQQAGVNRIVGSGSALARNQVLRQEVEKVFAQPVIYGRDADSAVGVALVLCDRLRSTNAAWH
ncbi:sedoheptulokinase isoform X2 [Syngnathus scovelli]|uniref:sedoheptulokinase isoform X2 n=1 Tax=Syngnathus scovelli TaxID=161590 RepID=UPI00210F7238|nr:sedoheptulokinase isoform X2 [Syngnathus scovelli]